MQSDHPQQLQAANLPAVLPHLATSPATENSGSESSHCSHQASCPRAASSSSFGARDQNGYKEQVAQHCYESKFQASVFNTTPWSVSNFQISQMDGTWDIDFSQEEESNNILRDEKVIEIEGRRDEKQLADRIQLRDSLRKRRMELLEELSELETRKLELCQTKEVVNTVM